MGLTRIGLGTMPGATTGGLTPGPTTSEQRTLELLTRVLEKFTQGSDKLDSSCLKFFGCGDASRGAEALRGIARRMNQLQQALSGGSARGLQDGGSSVQFSATVEQVQWEVVIQDSDGTSGRIRMSLQRVEVRMGQQVQQGDPLVLDLGDDGIDLVDHTEGVNFDLEGTGQSVRTAFVQGNDALLALDLNGNGHIDSGRELFGDQNGSRNGFEELARYDDNGDGRIDRDDAVYTRLRLWQDLDRNGASRRSELSSLVDKGIRAIELHYDDVDEEAGRGGRLAQRGRFVRDDGSTGLAGDALFNFVA